jgi:enoyl-CoA hydratase
MVSYQCFQLTVRSKLALIEMSQPEKLNILDERDLQELEDVLHRLKATGVKAAVITGQGRAFAAGADVSAMATMDAAAATAFSRKGNDVFQQLEDHPAIFIAAINGFALGGGLELALACDLRLASTKAVFAQPEIGLGIMPGFGGTQRLPRLIGPARAKEWIFTGRRYSAQEALEAGLVSKVVEPDQLLVEAQALGEELAAKSGPILALAKQAVNASMGVTAAHGGLEAELFGRCFTHQDAREGLQAFVEKRAPIIQDR